MLKPFHYKEKKFSNSLSNPRRGSLTPTNDKNKKGQKFSKSLEKIGK